MENHPIPQDVTGFKFKLIGSVTLKQFLYIAGGGVLAAVCFMLPITGIIKYPLSFLFGAVGAALAFVPIDGRPMDVMMKNFIKALPAENQYIYKKRGALELIDEFFAPKIVFAQATPAQQAATPTTNLDAKRAMLFSTLRQSYRPDEKEEAVLNNINTFLNESSHSVSPKVKNADFSPIVPPTPQPHVETQAPLPANNPAVIPAPMPSATVALPKETVVARPAPVITNAESIPAAAPVMSIPTQPVVIEESQQKASLGDDIKVVDSVPVAAPQAPKPTPKSPTPPPTPRVTIAPQEPIPTTPKTMASHAPSQQASQALTPNTTANVTSVTPGNTLKAGFPELPDTPNVVMGIIKDPRGKILPNILVEILDLQGIPVRAFKTNALGQFAAATPLPNGEYTVALEDPRSQNEFGQIHISLKGEIFQPLEIISVDQREKLRRELFGNTAGAQAV